MNLNKLRTEFAKQHKLKKLPKNIDLSLFDNKFNIVTKPIRTLSGVAPVAIMTLPRDCSHGSCSYCPGGLKSFFGDVPKSYTGNEPASMRAKRANFDPYLQIFNRLEQYILLNQFPEKVELIIMGGTFPSYRISYQDNFVMYAFKAMNDFSKLFFKDNKLNINFFKEFFELPSEVKNVLRTKKLQKKILKLKKTSNLKKEQLKNETSKVRCVAFCIETRPDFCKKEHINQMLKLGVTRVELGIQSLNNNILEKINRGHTVKDSIEAISLLKDSFLKVNLHIMPGLPLSNKKQDISMFKELFSNQNFKPDGLKIYPCMVMPGTKLYENYKKNKFKPLTTSEATKIIIEAKKYIPKYCRIYRIQRDIPTKYTIAGVDITNLRQHIHNIMAEKNLKCNCIRCREPQNKQISWEDVKLNRIDYNASNGKEIFLSFDDMKNNILLGFLRLRIPYKPFRKEITKNSAGIREMHVYGTQALIGKKGSIQHKGLGKKLLKEAEKIAKEFNIKKMIIISGIGVKEYFKKFGYKKEGFYVTKNLS